MFPVVPALLKFSCSGCAQHLSADSASRGSSGTCPNCGLVNVVPKRKSSSAKLILLVLASVAGAAILVAIGLVSLAIVLWNREAPLPALSSSQRALIRTNPSPEFDPAPDENLLLLAKLENLFESLPLGPAGNQSEEQLQAARGAEMRIREYVNTASLDPSLLEVCDRFLDAWKARVVFQAATGQINSAAAQRLSAERLDNSTETGAASGRLWAGLENAGASTGQSLGAAAFFGLASFFLTDSLQASQRDGQYQTQLAAALAVYQGTLEANFEKAATVAATLANRHGWSPEDALFDWSEPQRKEIAEYSRRGELDALRQVAADRSRGRPSNPYAVTNYLFLRVTDGKAKTTSEHLSLADSAYVASTRFPVGRIYEVDRIRCLLLAAWNALQAADTYGKGAFLNETNDLTLLVSAYSHLLQAADPKDFSGTSRLMAAWSNGHNGNFREAHRLLDEARPFLSTNGEFDFLDARVAGRQQNGPQAISALKAAFSHGFSDVSKIRRSQDFAPLSSKEREEIRALASPRWEWKVVWGFLPGSQEDVILTNQSPFPLSNVVLRPVIIREGKMIAPVLRIASIPAAGSFTWSDCMYVPGGAAESVQATLQCDQTR